MAKTRYTGMLQSATQVMTIGALYILGLALPATAQVCSHLDNLGFYSHGDYTVREVRIQSPFDFLHAVAGRLNLIKATLPLQPHSVFAVALFNDGHHLIREQLKADDVDSDLRFRLIVVVPRIENCDEGQTHQ